MPAVIHRQVAPGAHAAQEPFDDRLRLLVVGDVAQDPHQHDRDRLGEIQRPGRLLQDRVGVAQVGVEVGGSALGGAGDTRANCWLVRPEMASPAPAQAPKTSAQLDV
jgi:hypothetical protein